MKVVKFSLVGLIVVFVIVIVVFSKDYFSTNGKVISNSKSTSIKNSNSITFMYETEEGSGEYQVSSDIEWPTGDYKFNSELSGCENGGELSWDDENRKVIMESNSSDKCYVYFSLSNGSFANYIINMYTEDGENNLFYHDGVGDYGSFEAMDNSYRFTGENFDSYHGTYLDNYVCFGTDDETCSTYNIYRIIGLFDEDGNGKYQLKLIKNSPLGAYSWDENGGANWGLSSLASYLNGTFLNEFSQKWQDKIAVNNWKVTKSLSYDDIQSAKGAYDAEFDNNVIYPVKIGLMYISDYLYSNRAANWNIDLSMSNYFSWLSPSADEWLISLYTRSSTPAAAIIEYLDISPGIISVANSDELKNVRPVFYLIEDIELISGTGSESDPYRIK